MNTVRQESNTKTARSVLCGAVLMLVAAFPQTALSADSPVLSDTPIANTTSVQVKPNIMLLMDTSNSMRFSHMPDEMEGTNNGAFPIGYKSYQCNILYYKPNQIYALPKDSTGAELPLPTFGAAFYSVYSEYVEGSSNPTTLVNLNTSFRAYDTTTRQYATVADPAQPAYYYVYTTATGVEPEFLNFAGAPCTNLDVGATTAASPAGTWTRVLVSSLSAAQQQNFAIWYSYYRTRISMIKSAVSLSFTPLTDSYRVGLVTVKPYAALVPSTADSVAAANYLAIDDFDTTQRLAWFKKLFSQVPGGSSPAREGLARVGRHYANKHDYINTGMDGDPMQYSCQQNFTIMTTDGYWNTAAETRGPVQLDGVTLVGNQDNQLDKTVANPTTGGTINIVPRPIWDGYPDTTRVLTEIVKEYSFDACTSLYGPLTTTQNLQSTEQNLESTTQTLQSTNQNLQSTNQNLRSTNRNRQSTAQTLQSTNQNLRSTNQNLRSTNQNLQDTTQIVEITTEITISTLQNLRSTNQNLRSTSQNLQSTTQTLQSTNQNRQSTNQNLRSTSQNLRSTTQTLQSTNQNLRSTNQNLRSTMQTLQSTSQDLQSTSQWFSFDATTELTTPVASCTSGGSITCTHSVTTNVPVSSCTPQTAAAGNLFLEITCPTSTTGPAAVASCTAAAESAGNSWTTTTCTPNNTTSVPVATCTAAAASAGNSWTTTTCPAPVVTTNVPVATCTAAAASAGNSWTTTTCPAPVTTGPSGVSSCTVAAAIAGNSYTSTTCTPNNTTNVPVATCTAAAANAGNSWTTTTCPAPVVTTNDPVGTCTAAAASAGNSWTTTTCPAPVVTTNVPVATCTAAAASAGNSWTTTTCPAPVTTGPSGVSSCTVAAAIAGNSYTSTTCTPNNTTNVPVATCTAAAANAGNSWTTTTCPAPVVTTNDPVGTCTAAAASAGNSWTTTTCPAPVVTTNVLVATCTAAAASAGNSWTTTTCPAPITTGPTVTGSCTPVAASAGNSWTATLCGVNTTTVGVLVCTPSPPTITCGTITTTNVPVATCTPSGPTPANGYTTTTCPPPVVTTNIPVATCTAALASAGNFWTTTTCPAPVVTTDIPVATCTAAAASAPNWITTTCPAPVTTGPSGVSSCTVAAAIAGNSYTSTTCTPNNTTNVPVATCTAAAADAGNGWTTTTCPAPVVTTNVPVATCTPAAASAGNTWTTRTCPAPVVTTDIPVATCTAAAASAPNWITTTCPAPVITGPSGVSSCTVAAAIAGNSYTSTTCTPNNTTNAPVATCTAAVASAGNGWKTTTCPAPVVTTDVPVASCSAAAANAGNSWTTTTCPPPVVATTPEVYNCLPVAASAGNSYIGTTCGAKLPGKELRARIGTTLTTTILSGTTITDGPNTGATSYQPSSGYAATDGICVPDGSTLVPALVVPVDGPPSTADIPPPAEPADTANINYTQTCASAGTSWPCTLESVTSSGSYNSLADVAQYYYVTDLRTGPLWDSNLAATPPTKNDNVPAAGTGDEDDKAPWQHMTTFTIALGVSGTVNFSPTYKNTPSGSADFQGIRNGTLSWPIWPDPALNYASDGTLYSNPKSIDDFWHTAVDGRGRYFSAGKPSDVVDGLRAVLNDLSKKQGSGAAAASSSQTPVQGNNIAFVAKYATTSWTGDIEAREIDLTTGQVLSPVFWRAQPLLDAKAGFFCDDRNIYLFRSGATNNLVDFKWNSGTCTSESIAQGNAPVTIAESTTTTVASAATVMLVTKDTITHPPPEVLTAMAQTGAATPRELNASDSILAGDVVTTTAGVTVAYSVPLYTTVTVAGTVSAVSRDTTTYPSPYVMTVTAKTGAGTPRALNVGDAILAGDVVATTAGATIKIEQVVTPLVTTLNVAEQAYFGSSKVALLSQHPDMSDGTSGFPDQRGLADNETLVNFVRGQRGNEGFVAKDAVRLYRKRESVLGDFVDAQPVFVKEPFASYKDAGYAAFKTNLSAPSVNERKGMLYAAANDGMLHAFYAGAVTVTGTPPTTVTTIDATGGKEAWAFIPTMVLDNLYKLADNDYANRHTFFVDGTPTIGDVYDTTSTAWKTVLVAGLNKGGKGYYALDVTDPDVPKALWEFKQSAVCYDSSNSSTFGADCNLGYSFGKPIITKLENGTWVALVTSGYNNVNGQPGDGEGFLYVLNVMSGQIISKVSTGVGDVTTPSGLAQINNFVDNALIDNTTKLVYGGDNEGNVWRFVVNELPDNPLTLPVDPVVASATLLGTTKDSAGVAQPITTRPELGEIAGKPWVFVGTGRLLGLPDLTDVSPQSVYGFDASVTYTDALLYPGGVRDALRPLLITSPAPDPITGNPVVGAKRTVACTVTTPPATECARPNGWVVDLPDAGERVNVDMGLELGTLVFASNVPKNTACSIGGYSWLNFVNFRTGLAVATSPFGVVSNYLGETLAVGLSIMRLPPTTPGGQGRSVVIVMGSSGVPIDIPLPVDVPPFAAKRVSWREVVQ